jgi:S1-C subfamily serine protease
MVLGPLTLTGVPVTEASPTQIKLGSPSFAASLGLAALARMDFIVDGIHGVACLRPKTSRPPPYQHNRLGAEFIPAGPGSDALVAQVAEGSPAYEAGVRNGDVVLSAHISPQYQKYQSELGLAPAGTKVVLNLQRGSEAFKATAILRDIVAPNSHLR